MKNAIDLSIDRNGRTDVMLDEFEGRVSGKMLYVLEMASDEVVERDNLVPLSNEAVAKM
jgi:hypothetical protein